ncbi:hypothetical protein [Legionella sp. WA2024007413]
MGKYFFVLGQKSLEDEEEEEYPLERGDEYYISSNNQHESLDPLLAAEYAVFSGNLLRHILGPEHPEYHLLRNKTNTNYYRAAKLLKNYRDWDEVIKISPDGSIYFQYAEEPPTNILELNIVGLIDLFVVCHFLGEIDWEGGNFGFIKNNDTFLGIRLDPGCSFNSFIIENNNINLEKYINNFVLNYLTNEITSNSEDDKYLTEILDHEHKKFKSPVAEILFSDRERIISTMIKIAKLSEKDLHSVKRKSFTAFHFSIAEKLIEKLLARRELYKTFINHLETNVFDETEADEHDESNPIGPPKKRKQSIKFFNPSSADNPHQSELDCDSNIPDDDTKSAKNKRIRITPSTKGP